MDSGHWVVDQSRSKLAVSIRHLGVATVEGDLPGVDVSVEVADDGVATVKASVPTEAISTGDEKRDEFLASPGFFQSEQHPLATFEGSGRPTVSESWRLYGTLTIAGVSAPFEVDVEQGPADSDRFGISATLDRHAYDLRLPQAAGAGDAVVGRKVTLRGEISLRLTN